jgi:hypothetical protein
MATPDLSGDTLTLGLNFAFHQKRLSEPRNIAIITKLTESIRQKPTTIRCIMAGPGPQKTVANDAITNISNIFGGAELLES